MYTSSLFLAASRDENILRKVVIENTQVNLGGHGIMSESISLRRDAS